MKRAILSLLLVTSACASGCITRRGMWYFLPEYETSQVEPSWMQNLGPNSAPPKPKLVWNLHHISFVEEERKQEEDFKSRAPIVNPVRSGVQKKVAPDKEDDASEN